LLQAARNGQRLLVDGEVVAFETAAEVRAPLLRAAMLHDTRLRLYERAVASGAEPECPEESIEAEAGAILRAERDVEIHELFMIADAWFDANKG
jgi:hypothetical protein